MKEQNKVLLESVIKDRLEKSLTNKDNADVALEEALKAIDRSIELEKQKKEKIIKYVEIGALVIAAPLIDAKLKKVFAEMICNFEKDYTFTTTAGRSLSSLFRFK